MEFVYESENMILKLTKHIRDKSIAELVSLFLNNENSQFQIDEKPGSRLEAKIQAIDLIINALLKTGNEQLGDEVFFL